MPGDYKDKVVPITAHCVLANERINRVKKSLPLYVCVCVWFGVGTGGWFNILIRCPQKERNI